MHNFLLLCKTKRRTNGNRKNTDLVVGITRTKIFKYVKVITLNIACTINNVTITGATFVFITGILIL